MVREKIWIVFLSLEHEINLDEESNAIQYISDFSDPLLNSKAKVPSTTLNTLITVPFSDAVARRVPSVFKARHAIGVSCALINGVLIGLSNDFILTYPFDLSGKARKVAFKLGDNAYIPFGFGYVDIGSKASNVK